MIQEVSGLAGRLRVTCHYLAPSNMDMGVILPDRFAGFRLLRPLGFGAVYEAERDGQRVALIFYAELLENVELERFRRDPRASRRASAWRVILPSHHGAGSYATLDSADSVRARAILRDGP